jgi:hypothetical protein
MNQEQLRAVRIVQEGVNVLADALVDQLDIAEDVALEIVRELPELTTKLQDGEIGDLYERAISQARRTIDSKTNPKEFYPGHPQHRPMYTTKSVFNAHVAQATAPYVIAITKKIAKDRGLEAPNDVEIKRALAKMDWAKAAYEIQKLPPKPPPGRMRQWFNKYVFGPLGKILDFPYDEVFITLLSLSAAFIMWNAFRDYLGTYGQRVVDVAIWAVEKAAGHR